MLLDVIIPFGSELWRNMLFASMAFISIPIFGVRNFPGTRDFIRKIFGLILVFTAISIHPYLIHVGTWNIHTSLPLQLCSLSGILSGIVLLFPSQLGFEFIMYWGLPAAIHSLLTPEMTQGSGNVIMLEYYLSHSGIILSALYLALCYDMRLRKGSWLCVFYYTQWLLPLVGAIDYLLDANYMYLTKRPMADNPFIIGEWPWYIIILDVVLLLHFLLVYFIFRSRTSYKPAFQ
jgi:hypothetical integral membrane protein (TIGR02206 family)